MSKSRREKFFFGLLAVGVVLGVLFEVARGLFVTLVFCATASFYGWEIWRDRREATPTDPPEEPVQDIAQLSPETLRWPWQQWTIVIVPLMIVVLGVTLRLFDAPLLVLFLLCGIGFALYLYSLLTEIEKVRTLRSDKPRRGPTIRDWTLLLVSLIFCAMGIFIAQTDLRTALGTLAVFGPCALLAVYTVARKIKRQRFNATIVSAPGGINLYASKTRALLLGLVIGIPGAVLLLLPGAPLLIRGCALIMLAASVTVICFVISGRISRRYIRFDPDGLSLGESRYEYLLPWDNISGVAETEYADNPIVRLNVHSPEAILVKPEARRSQLYRAMAKNAAWMGAPVILMPQHFAMDSATLTAALLRYVQLPEARADLVTYTAIADHR